jgi:hypothetical protein
LLGLWIVDVVAIQFSAVGGMRADGEDGMDDLDAVPVRLLCSLERKPEEAKEVGNNG